MAADGVRLWPLLVLALLVGCAPDQQQQTHSLQACESVRAQGSFQLVLRAGTEPGLVLQGPDAQLEASFIEQAPSGLLINAPGEDVKISLTCPQLNELELIGAVRASNAEGQTLSVAKLAAYGSSVLQVSGVQADDLDLRTSGQASIEVPSVLAETVNVQSSSNSRLRLAGETGRLYMSLRGAAQIDAAKLSAQWVEVSVLDSSSASVQASAHLKGQVADTASLQYTGTPDLDLQTLADE